MLLFMSSGSLLTGVFRAGGAAKGLPRMLEKLKNADKVVGTRRLVRAIQAGEIAEAYIARDADLFIVRQVRQACNAAGVRMVEVDTMKQLGEACGIEVKAASAGIRK